MIRSATGARITFIRTSASVLGAGLASASFGRAVYAAGEPYSLRLSISQPKTNGYYLAMSQFASNVERKSNGQLKVEVYPSNELATAQNSVMGLTTGVVDLTVQQVQWLQPMFPQVEVFDMPYMFKDADAVYRVMNGPIGNEIFSAFETKGIVGLAWGGAGFRQMQTTTKAIVEPADLKGLRFRIQGGGIHAAMMQTLGAIPVQIDFSEIFVAFSTHVVDGMEVNVEEVVTQKLYDMIRHIAISNHTYSPSPLIGSKKKIDSLPPNLQKILKDEAKAIAPIFRGIVEKRSIDAVQDLKSRGVVFTEIDYPAFRKAMEPVYATFGPKIGTDLIQRVSQAAAAPARAR